MIWLAVAVSGGLGAVLRTVVVYRYGSPRGTVMVNVVGTLALAVLVRISPGADALVVLGVGFAGGLTTFSTWMLDAVKLAVDDPTASLMHIGKVAAVAVLIAAAVLA